MLATGIHLRKHLCKKILLGLLFFFILLLLFTCKIYKLREKNRKHDLEEQIQGPILLLGFLLKILCVWNFWRSIATPSLIFEISCSGYFQDTCSAPKPTRPHDSRAETCWTYAARPDWPPKTHCLRQGQGPSGILTLLELKCGPWVIVDNASPLKVMKKCHFANSKKIAIGLFSNMWTQHVDLLARRQSFFFFKVSLR